MSTRRNLDQYFTPRHATEALLQYAPEVCGQWFFECTAGDGAIVKVLLASNRFRGGESNDLDWNMFATHHQDATTLQLWQDIANRGRVDWVISNPPFNQAAQIIPRAYECAKSGIAMLLRLSYLEPCFDRDQWLANHPPTRLVVLPRISFTNDGKTDNVTCAWFVWEKPNSEGAETANTQPIIIVPRSQPRSGQLTLGVAA